MQTTRSKIIDSVGLPDEKVEELFDALNEKEVDQKDLIEELREYPRFPFEHHGNILITPIAPDEEKKTYRARVRNVSCGGVGILHGFDLEPGSDVEVFLEVPGGENIEIKGSVAYKLPVFESLYQYGITFRHPVDINPLFPEESPDKTPG